MMQILILKTSTCLRNKVAYVLLLRFYFNDITEQNKKKNITRMRIYRNEKSEKHSIRQVGLHLQYLKL